MNQDEHILHLENQIFESRIHYNNIARLLGILRAKQSNGGNLSTAAVSLCRVFAQLMVAGNMTKTKDTPENEIRIIDWLKNMYKEFLRILLDVLERGKSSDQV